MRLTDRDNDQTFYEKEEAPEREYNRDEDSLESNEDYHKRIEEQSKRVWGEIKVIQPK